LQRHCAVKVSSPGGVDMAGVWLEWWVWEGRNGKVKKDRVVDSGTS
jgi:hypothetical protein